MKAERPYAVATIDDLERFPVDDEGLVWRPVRQHFGIEAFGVNAYTAEAAGHRIVEEHSEAGGHEELYFVARGTATFTLDGETVEAPAGTFVFARPGTRRGAIAREAGTTVLALGGKRGEAFRVSGWEAAFAAFALQRLGRVEDGRALFVTALEQEPDSSESHYNYACFEALAGERGPALEHLRRAIELDPQSLELARTDSDFDAIRSDPAFPA